MASITTSNDARVPLAVISNKKRSAEDGDAKPPASNDHGTSPELSPFYERKAFLEKCCQESDKIIHFFFDSDELLWKTGKLEELGIDDENDMEDDEREAAYDSLTQQQVDEHLKVMVVDRMFGVFRNAYFDEIMLADPQNKEGERIFTFDKYSSEYMYPVINSMLKNATKEINAAKRRVNNAGSEDTTDFALGAFNSAFAAVLACDSADQWRDDYWYYPEDSKETAKKVSKLCCDLLWFDDHELGFVEPYSRKVMLEKLEAMNTNWNLVGGVKFATVRNGQGLGRSHGPPPQPKKPRRTNAVPVVASGSMEGSKNEVLVTFLNAVQGDKKKFRARTCLQLKIASVSEPEKSELVLISGMTNMKKLNQLCAYITGHSNKYDYSSQQGVCIKGSRIELELEGAKMWLAAKGLGKQAAQDGAALFEDRPVRIIQVFQGLNTSPTSRIVYDSDMARDVKVYWVTPKDERYEITAQAIVANKCAGDIPLLPRLVKHLDSYDLAGYVPNLRTSFGRSLYGANNYLDGDREGESYLVLASWSAEDVRKIVENREVEPIANEDGTIRNDKEYRWRRENVASAGLPPTNAQY